MKKLLGIVVCSYRILSNKLDTRLDHLEIDQGFVVYERRKPA